MPSATCASTTELMDYAMSSTVPVHWFSRVLRLLPGPIRSALDGWSYALAQKKAALRAARGAQRQAAGASPVPVPARPPQPHYPTWSE